MTWLYLLIAGIFEIFWAVGIKYCDGLKITLPLILVIVSMGLSIIFLGLATKTIPMNIAYAIWTGIGIVGVFAYGLLILKDPISTNSIIFVGMILIGIIGLKLGVK
ncbi:MAG: multidrug efflux SMR transporter [Rickettsiaceae bacterium]|nr:multidrug efflux SMR transporter [Rickettsiaceae bacterium]